MGPRVYLFSHWYSNLFSDNCTSNLNNHMKACKKQQAASEKAAVEQNGEPPLQQSSLVPFIQGSTYTYGHLVPSADTVSHDLKEVYIYIMVKKEVKKLLQGAHGKIHIAQDGWSAPQKLSLMRLVIVWVQDGKMQVLTMDMIHLHELLMSLNFYGNGKTKTLDEFMANDA
ncbi:uncharacterized protein EV420DRAFT_1487733 [Desarmillaria tabescens]|uniref:DUF659 domain-containing protein n=1 Tax=Armillaria tabescens TaxID=1929756 RepID=A0AA39J4E7_ARMTA|nr:uncharacterized protein EV420DRAFT_1487733 [Desarmillaria tabescens]KAK0435940.1 hypothetical protein EV420DRAFT_1487733 [Desarmillaria tabescens]